MIKASHIFVVAVLIFGVSVAIPAHAGWALYDDFESGSIDPTKWNIDDSSATISIEGGQAKFVHQQGHAEDPSYLLLKPTQSVKAIRAKLRVESCSGDVRVRVKGNKWVDDQGYEMYQQLAADAQNQTIHYYCGALDKVNSVDQYELFYGQFYRPIPVLGQTYSVEISFTDNWLRASVDGLGDLFFHAGASWTEREDPFYGIGTKSVNGDGPCTAYFDDVYVKY